MRYLAENGTCRTSCPDRYFRRPAAAAVETAVPQLTVARPSTVFGVDGIMTPGSCEVEDYGCVWKWEIKPQNCALIIRDNQFDDESTLFPDNPPMILRWDLLQLRIGVECEKCVDSGFSVEFWGHLQVLAWAPVMGPYFAVFVEMLGLIGPGPPLLYSPNQDV